MQTPPETPSSAAEKSDTSQPSARQLTFKIEPQRGTARIKIRYIESNHVRTGCTFCA